MISKKLALRRVEMTFLYAVLIGALIGGLTLVASAPKLADSAMLRPVRSALEGMELATLDWRLRALAKRLDTKDIAVVVSVDDETRQRGWEVGRPEWATFPWARSLWAELIDQAFAEGATRVVITMPLVGPSSRARRESGKMFDDDATLTAATLRSGDRLVFGMESTLLTDDIQKRTTPRFLRRVGDVAETASAFGFVKAALTRGNPIYFTEVSGGGYEIWEASAVGDDNDAPRGSIRPWMPSDQGREFTGQWLWQLGARIDVDYTSKAALPAAGRVVGPWPELISATTPLALMHYEPDSDGVLRQMPLLYTGSDGSRLAGLALRSVVSGDGEPLRFDGHSARFTPWKAVQHSKAHQVPTGLSGRLMLAWSEGHTSNSGLMTPTRIVPAWKLLANAENAGGRTISRRFDNLLSGRVVVLADARLDPFSVTPVGSLPRSSIFAQGITNLVSEQAIERASLPVEVWLGVGMTFAGALLALLWSSLYRGPGLLGRIVAIALSSGAYALVAKEVFLSQRAWVPMALPLIGFALSFLSTSGYALGLDKNLRAMIERIVGRRVSEKLLRRIVREMKPTRRSITAMYVILDGLPEMADPQVVVRVYQEYVNFMGGIINDHGGIVDRHFHGAAYAYFGVPLAHPERQAAACRAALVLVERFAEKRIEWERALDAPVSLRLAISSGRVLVGHLSDERYTLLGSMLEEVAVLARHSEGMPLVTDALSSEVGSGFHFRRITDLGLQVLEGHAEFSIPPQSAPRPPRTSRPRASAPRPKASVDKKERK